MSTLLRIIATIVFVAGLAAAPAQALDTRSTVQDWVQADDADQEGLVTLYLLSIQYASPQDLRRYGSRVAGHHIFAIGNGRITAPQMMGLMKQQPVVTQDDLNRPVAELFLDTLALIQRVPGEAAAAVPDTPRVRIAGPQPLTERIDGAGGEGSRLFGLPLPFGLPVWAAVPGLVVGVLIVLFGLQRLIGRKTAPDNRPASQSVSMAEAVPSGAPAPEPVHEGVAPPAVPPAPASQPSPEPSSLSKPPPTPVAAPKRQGGTSRSLPPEPIPGLRAVIDELRASSKS